MAVNYRYGDIVLVKFSFGLHPAYVIYDFHRFSLLGLLLRAIVFVQYLLIPARLCPRGLLCSNFGGLFVIHR